MENDNQSPNTQEDEYDDYDDEDDEDKALLKQIKLVCSSIFTLLFFVIGIGLYLLVICADDFDPWGIIIFHLCYSPFYLLGTLFAVVGLYLDKRSKICILGLILNGIPTLISLVLFLTILMSLYG